MSDVTDASSELELEYVNIDDLRMADYNPRSISQIELQKLARSIEEFGFVDPIIVNRRSMKSGHPNEGPTIVGGHQRVRAAILLGWKQVPAVFVELTPGGEKALNLALNRIQGEWDGTLLADVLAELQEDTSIDVLLSGFDQGEIDRLVEAANIEIPDEFPDMVVVPGDAGTATVGVCPSCSYEAPLEAFEKKTEETEKEAE